jgi:hypothetical protein
MRLTTHCPQARLIVFVKSAVLAVYYHKLAVRVIEEFEIIFALLL